MLPGKKKFEKISKNFLSTENFQPKKFFFCSECSNSSGKQFWWTGQNDRRGGVCESFSRKIPNDVRCNKKISMPNFSGIRHICFGEMKFKCVLGVISRPKEGKVRFTRWILKKV